MAKQIEDRLASAAEAVTLALEHLATERGRRNELVLTARRDGLSYGRIAFCARITRARVMHIVAETA